MAKRADPIWQLGKAHKRASILQDWKSSGMSRRRLLARAGFVRGQGLSTRAVGQEQQGLGRSGGKGRASLRIRANQVWGQGRSTCGTTQGTYGDKGRVYVRARACEVWGKIRQGPFGERAGHV